MAGMVLLAFETYLKAVFFFHFSNHEKQNNENNLSASYIRLYLVTMI